MKWHVGRYVTHSKQDILQDLGSAIHKTQGWDTESPQVDPITSFTMTGIEDTWACPMETQWADENIFPLPRHQSEAKIEDKEASLVDPTTSSVMSDTKDTQSGPMETSPADHITVPLAKLNAETQKNLLTVQAASPTEDTEMKKDLPTAWAASLAELEGQVAPTARSVNESVALPTPSGHMAKGRLGVPALTASMDALKLEAPSVVATLPGATVEELAKEDMAEGCP